MQKEFNFITTPLINAKGHNQFVRVLAIQDKTWIHRIFESLSLCSRELNIGMKEVSDISLKRSYTCAKGWTFIRFQNETIIPEEIKFFQEKRKQLDTSLLPATRSCSSCKKDFPLTPAFFHRGRTSSKYAKLTFKTTCKECRKQTHQKHYETRKEKILNDKLLKAKSILAIYRKIDRVKGREFDLTLDWIQSNIIDSVCFYCEDDKSIGIERKDNAKGHTQNNCVPCCKICNITRMNNFTHNEFIKIGVVIKEIKSKRNGPTT